MSELENDPQVQHAAGKVADLLAPLSPEKRAAVLALIGGLVRPPPASRK